MASCSALLQVGIVDRSVEPFDGVDRLEGARVVADLDRRHGPREQHLGPGVVVQCVGPRHQLVDPPPSFGHPVAHLPEQPEHAEHVRERRDVVGEQPADRHPQVLLLGTESVGPLDLSFRRPAGVRHELGEVLGVSPPHVGTGAAGGEPLGGELAHRHEHAEAGFDAVGDDADEAVAGERVEEVQRFVLGALGDTGGRVDRPTVGEDRQRLHELELRFVEEPEAPLDGRPQGALALGEVDRSRAQRVEDVLESGEQRRRCEQPRAGRGELDRQRQPVETSADLHHGGGVGVVHGELAAHGPGPLDEEAHGGERGELGERRRLGERRHRQRRDGVLALGAKAQRGAAGGEDRDAGARDQELIEVGRHAGHLLEIVEDEQRRGLLEALDQGVERRARALDRGADGGGDARQHQRRIGDRRQRHELRAAPGPIECGRRPRSPVGSCRSHPVPSA